MDIPRYLQILWDYKWLLLGGVVAAALAGLLAGFTIVDGQLVSRAERSYTAATTVLLEAEQSTLLQSEIPGQEVDQTVTAPIRQDLSSVSVVYAYLASSEEIRQRVEDVIGPLSDTEDVTAVSRTTQPGGDERFPGRLELPIIDIMGVANEPARAELISTTANDVFQEYIVEQQEDALVPTESRVNLVTLREHPSDEGEGGNPAVPVIIAGGGVLLAFIALIYIIHGVRVDRRRRRESPRARRSRRSDAGETPAVEAEREPESEFDLALRQLSPRRTANANTTNAE